MFVFVILHYQALQETIGEVEHVLKELSGEKRVVVVDNASPNKSGAKLKKYFENYDIVDVLQNDENSGYAIGNNLGIKYALDTYDPDFVVVANNDIEIKQNNFCDLIRSSFKENNFDLLGPDIFVPETGIHQNPKKKKPYTIEQVKEMNWRSRKIMNQPTILFWMRANLKKNKLLRKYVLNYRHHNTAKENTVQYNVVLHGSFLVFSRHFFEKIRTPFDFGTFFYFETEILNMKMSDQNMLSKYDPRIIVYHHQNTATRQSFQNAIDQQKFQLTNMVKSTQRFIDLFK